MNESRLKVAVARKYIFKRLLMTGDLQNSYRPLLATHMIQYLSEMSKHTFDCTMLT
jgi:hypothetical protein